MTIRQCVAGYLGAAVVFLALDALWLWTMADRLYRPALGGLLAERFRFAPALLFYLIYLGGLLLFAVAPALQSGRWTTALLLGGELGFVAYATYDLTNQATLRDWPWHVTLADLCWGTFVSAVAAAAGARAALWLGGPR